MFSTGWFRSACVCGLLMSGIAPAPGPSAVEGLAQPPPAATLYRVFLRDGTTVVSYGEFARVADRVVLSLPMGGTAESPELQLLSLPSDSVDWEKTDAYAESARATRYAQTRGPDDFALLNQAVSMALTDIALTKDPQRKIAMAAEARQNVTKWAAEHYAYRAKDVADLAALFDEVIAETRASGGMPNFDLSLVANMAEPPAVPLQPMPTLQESVEQALNAVTLAPDAGERTSLLRSIEKVLLSAGGAAWVPAVRARVSSSLAAEDRTDRAYVGLTRDSLAAADRSLRAADVTGVERVVRRALREDDRLGQRRPNEMASLLAMLDAKLDDARRLRLARDSFEARAELIRAYQRDIAPTLETARLSRPALDQIRRLAGPSRSRLTRLSAQLAAAIAALAKATVPPEASLVHDHLRNALRLAARAAELRLQAIRSSSMPVAWEASSAAAGALLLFEQVTAELPGLLKPPAPR